MSRFIEKSATAKVKKTFLAPILLSVLAAAAAVAFLFASEHSWVHGGLEEGVEPSAFQSAEAEDEIVREYLDFLNEFSGRRRLNVFFVNQQAAAYGLQLRYVNTGRGNLTYARRDISATGRLPLMAVRVYDSSLGEGSDLGLGWRLSAAETIEVGRDGSLTLTDESASRIRFLPDSRSGLYREAVLAPSPIEGILRESVGTLKVRMRSGLVKTFGRLGSPYRLTRVQDRHGNWIGLDYDEHSRLSAMRGSNGRSIRFQRNGAGRIAAAEDELGRRVEYIYDSQGRLSAAMDLGGNRWSYVYGQGGRLVQALDPLGMPLLEASYDEAGRVSALRTARSHFRYRYEGGRTLASDAHDATSVFTHNEDGVTVQVENSVGVISRVELDGAGEAERLWVDGRVTWEADNDLLGRPRTVRLHEPGQEIRRVQFTYDETGRVAASSQEGIRMRHDPLLRETSRTEDGEETLYGYNDQGDLSSLVLGDRH
ncbi:MAG TPA: DUF6531 domain-containing protein, partial [Acidobacteriota bacterium]|nr:DUF6531 domain-containing protein [Acidobacteriota bacterium]